MREEAVCTPCTNIPQYIQGKERRERRCKHIIPRYSLQGENISCISSVSQDRVTHYGIINARLITIRDSLQSIKYCIRQSKDHLLQCCRLIHSSRRYY